MQVIRSFLWQGSLRGKKAQEVKSEEEGLQEAGAYTMFRGTRDKPINHGLDLEAKHPAQVSLCPGNRAVGGTCRALNGFSSRLYCSIGNFFLC